MPFWLGAALMFVCFWYLHDGIVRAMARMLSQLRSDIDDRLSKLEQRLDDLSDRLDTLADRSDPSDEDDDAAAELEHDDPA